MKRMATTWILLLCAATLLAPTTVWADVEEDIEELNDRLDELELKTAKNKLSFFGDFRVRYDYQKWHVNPYQQLMGFDFNNVDPQSGMPAPVFMPVEAYEADNSESWSARLRLKMDYKAGKSVHFTGRLNMHRQFGGSHVPLFNGFPNTVLSSFNSTAVPTDDLVHVERAAVTWDPQNTPFFFTLGRQAATGGPPKEFRENKVRQGTPGALMIDAQIDGLMAGFHLGAIGLPEEGIVRLCYGTGFEAGFGSGGLTNQTFVNMYFPDANNPGQVVAMPMPVSELEDSKVMGFCAETPIPALGGDNLLSFGGFRMLAMTDIPYGMTRGFPNVLSTQPQAVTATTNLGDMDLFGACWQHTVEIGEAGYELTYFGSFATNKSHPDEGTFSLYGFGPMLGNSSEDLTGKAYYVGVQGDVPPTGGKLGFEFNRGDENWFAYLSGADDVNSKLSTRGSVFEAYYIQPIQKGFDFRVGMQSYQYDYAFSGWHISPGPIENFELNNEIFSPYPFPDTITNVYAVMDLTF